MRSPVLRSGSGIALLALLTSAPAVAMDATVPSILYPDFKSAVLAVSASPETDNQILVGAPSVIVDTTIVLTNLFGLNRRLVIRPVSTLARAQIRSEGAGAPIFSLAGCGNVTIQDLDILRIVTNTADLIQSDHTTFITVERCRIGSSEPPGPGGLSYVRIAYPGDGGFTFRNCIFFSTFKQAFDFGINVVTMGDASNAIYLYNNCVADYNMIGVQVNDGTNGSLVLLRNNVVVNNVVSIPEPVAYQSGVIDGVIVVTSNNLAFGSPGKVQTGAPPNQDIFGTAATQVPVVLPPTAPEEASAFVSMAWDATPGAANSDFYRTVAAGPLHDSPGKFGVSCGIGTPDAHDLAVVDDFDRSIRPGGVPLHTDRGPFQVDPSTASVADRDATRSLLMVSAERNPTATLRLRFSAGISGTLTADLFDASGRRSGEAIRSVRAGENGVVSWPRPVTAGVYVYRVALKGSERQVIERTGKVSVVK